MFNIANVSLDWKGLNLKLETGLVSRQADGAVLATLGGTSVLCCHGNWPLFRGA